MCVVFSKETNYMFHVEYSEVDSSFHIYKEKKNNEQDISRNAFFLF